MIQTQEEEEVVVVDPSPAAEEQEIFNIDGEDKVIDDVLANKEQEPREEEQEHDAPPLEIREKWR